MACPEGFGELVRRRTNSRIRMRIYHSALLGQQDGAIQQMSLGSIRSRISTSRPSPLPFLI